MENFTMERVTFNVTCLCNLKCKLCGAYIPYLHNESKEMKMEYPLEHWIKILDRYFEIVSFVNVFVISGGEPLLYPALPAFINYLKNYESAIGKVQIVTNGTIIPNYALIDAAKNFGGQLYFNIDNYGEISKAVKESDAILEQNGISHIVRNYTKDNPHCGGWVNFGGMTEQIHKTQEEVEQLFAKCANSQRAHFCFLIAGNEMWPCDPARRRRYLKAPDNDSEYLNLLDSSLSIEEQQEKITSIYAMKSLSACSYCNGLCADSTRVVPGEQLTQEELVYVKAGARSYEEVLAMMSAKQSGE